MFYTKIDEWTLLSLNALHVTMLLACDICVMEGLDERLVTVT